MKKALVFSVILILSGYLSLNAQSLAITGKVTDSNGSALPWTSVTLKGSETSHTRSDKDGKYLLNLTSNRNDTLIFSHIGYEKQEIALNNQRAINAILTKSIIDSSGVVAIAYGNGKKTGISAIEIPNAYQWDNSIEIPNAYNPNKDKSIKIPNARLIKPNPEDSTVIINKVTPKFLPNPER